ncbi:MAG: LuxR C-terminal-related transcriptional regulator [Nitriliruptoraceae bacterium]
MRRIAATAVGELLEREGALRSLTAVLDDAEHGHGAVVVISGEPGIGKTALVTRFASEVDERARLLLGICDDLTTPRPLGPFRDIADQLPEPISSQLSNGVTPGEFATLLVRELRHAGAPSILVIEDVHWVDQATIDVLTVIGRRAAELPVVLVLTLRPGELAPDDPLRGAIGAIRRSTTLHLELAPLSHAAVARLAGDQVDRIHELSRGNPFFVTELVAHGHDPPPPSLANAVLGRVGRLEPSLRHLLELICVVPGRVTVELLDRLEPAWAHRVEQAERQRILHIDRRHVRFHHELSRAALHSSLPWGRRRQLHGRIVDALLELGADPADVAHHAEAAGCSALAAEYALLAGRQAAASGAHREALAHLRRAADDAQDRLAADEQASLHEELGHSAWLTGRIEESLSAISTAIDMAVALDDVPLHGRCTALRAHVHWFSGDGAAAWHDASDAVRILESAGSSRELVRASAQAAELSMVLSRIDDAQRWGHRALELAGDRDDLRVRARSAIGGSRLQLDVEDADDMLAALELARDTGDTEQVVFSRVTLAVLHLLWVLPDAARTHAEQARSCARDQDFEAMTAFVDAFLAWLNLREGDPDAAARLAGIEGGRRRDVVGSLAEQQAQIVLAERAVRVGADDAAQRLHDVATSADRTRMLVHIGPVLELEVEHALNEDAPLPLQRFEQLGDVVGHQPLRTGCSAARIAAWGALCGRTVDFRGEAPAPYAAMIDRDWGAAADAFGAVGWRHDRALLLSLVPQPDALAEALSIARSLGAAPLETRVCRRMRSLGLSVPRGPRASTQANPAQLTERQLEVCRHLAAGRSNIQIAEVLHISPRTAEHHVASILAKLEVTSRAEAVARAVELGLA